MPFLQMGEAGMEVQPAERAWFVVKMDPPLMATEIVGSFAGTEPLNGIYAMADLGDGRLFFEAKCRNAVHEVLVTRGGRIDSVQAIHLREKAEVVFRSGRSPPGSFVVIGDGRIGQVVEVREEQGRPVVLVKSWPRIDYERLLRTGLATQSALNRRQPSSYLAPQTFFNPQLLRGVATCTLSIGGNDWEAQRWDGRFFVGACEYGSWPVDMVEPCAVDYRQRNKFASSTALFEGVSECFLANAVGVPGPLRAFALPPPVVRRRRGGSTRRSARRVRAS